MKMNETKEIKAILPPYFQTGINTLEEHRKSGDFSAWSVGNSEYFVSTYAADEALPPDISAPCCHPYFDLASLTKPLFFNAFLRHKWKDDFQGFVLQPLSAFPWIKNNWNSDLLKFISKNESIHFNTFLSHKSYFEKWIWCKFFISVRNTENIKKDFFQLLLKHYDSTITPTYSDLNYMFLSLLIESLFDIDDWQKEINHLNNALQTNFFHASVQPEKTAYAIPSYPYLTVSQFDTTASEKRPFGFVHDTNANLFALLPDDERIVSGHAGLYGNIHDVLQGMTFLRRTQPFAAEIDLKDRFLYGLDTTAITTIPQSLGHLGYTGTAFAFKEQKTHDSDNNDFILLTNRTSKRKTQLEKIIPQIYIITNRKTNEENYFFVYQNKIENLSKIEFFEQSQKYFSETKKIWNDSIIFDYYNMTDLRNELGKQIC